MLLPTTGEKLYVSAYQTGCRLWFCCWCSAYRLALVCVVLMVRLQFVLTFAAGNGMWGAALKGCILQLAVSGKKELLGVILLKPVQILGVHSSLLLAAAAYKRGTVPPLRRCSCQGECWCVLGRRTFESWKH